MKKLSFAFSMLTLFAFAGQAYGQLAVTDLKTAELDADGKPAPVTDRHQRPDDKSALPDRYRYASTFLGHGKPARRIYGSSRNRFILQVTYADGSRDMVTFDALTKAETG
jgi:hypothetical protein